jgi:HEAT repeat protein
MVRRNAARAIGDVLYKAGSDAVTKLASDSKEDEEVRLFAASAGAKLGSFPCSEVLAQLAQSPKTEIRSRAIFALGKAGGLGQLSAIENALLDKESTVREDAVLALGLIGKDEILPALIKALNDEDRLVRGAAMDALRRQTKQKIDNDIPAWKKWWEEKKSTKPADPAKKTDGEKVDDKANDVKIKHTKELEK